MLSEDSEKKIVKEAKAIMRAINSMMRDEFKRYEGINYNPNTKGADYEKAVADVLTDYLGAEFDFYVRAQVIDAKFQYVEVLGTQGNEIDVIGTFKDATPKLILKTATSVFVPYDAVALVVEVKSIMDKQKLQADLEKLAKVARLEQTPERMGMALGGRYNIQRPLRMLVYFDSSISEEERLKLLNEHYAAWDAILILEKDMIILNLSLPISQAIIPQQLKELRILDWVQNPFVIMLLLIVGSVPVPLGVNVLQTLINLDTYSKKGS